MECLVCKHKYLKFGNYLRHLSIEHPDINTENIRNENKQKGKQTYLYINCVKIFKRKKYKNPRVFLEIYKILDFLEIFRNNRVF